jgi:hypothetical protein
MNTKWLKQHAVLLGFVGAFLVVLGVLIWLQQQAAAKRQEIDNQLAEQLSQRDHFLEAKPPPTQENIKIEKQNRQQLDRLYNDILTAIGHSQLQTQEVIRPGGFLQLMASQFAGLHQLAEKNTVKLPDGFAFGFSRYVGPSSAPPARGLSEQDTTNVLAQLQKQLRAIEKLSQLLIESRVDEIIQIRRAEVEPGSSNPDALEIPISADSKGLYETLPFELRFTCTTEALRTFLNSLSKSDWFFAVRSMHVTGPTPSAEASAPGAGAAEAARRTQLNVTIRLDLIEFPPKPPAKPSA